MPRGKCRGRLTTQAVETSQEAGWAIITKYVMSAIGRRGTGVSSVGPLFAGVVLMFTTE